MFVAQQLGRYHLLDRVAFGGMAEIYRAKTFDSQGHEHMVAIKRVLRHLAEDDDFLQMLVDEAKIATLLEHPNIAKVFEFVRVGDEYFIAMEYIDGKDLRSILDRCRAEGIWIPFDDCAYIAMRALDALQAAHDKTDGAGRPLDIVHRDVSPSNIIVSYQGQVKLCDFGIAKAAMTRVQTRTGVIKGKVRYMSPEQALGRKLDRRSDVFSAGSVLYEMLTKQCPFQAENEMELIFRVRDAKYPRPSRYNPEVPPALERIVKQALARSRSSRFQSASEYGDALREYLTEHSPDYRPGKLGRFLRKLFADDIEHDLRKLEEFSIGRADVDQLGENLLSEVLGEGAAYTQFTPVDPALLEDPNMRTKILPRVPPPEQRLPQGVNLHDMKTEIIDQDERDKRIIKRRSRPRPGANYHRDSKRATQIGTVQVDREALGLTPGGLDPGFHA
ncbi:MAG: serine/threonine protein kinase, partial [Myxococcales bacterium]|nr:serine/threonine protein kinase [Myxococcales bacterium]